MKTFGVWSLPSTIDAYRLAVEARFEPAHYDAAEKTAKRRHHLCITRSDVQEIVDARNNHVCTICVTCGLFHEPPACESVA